MNNKKQGQLHIFQQKNTCVISTTHVDSNYRNDVIYLEARTIVRWKMLLFITLFYKNLKHK